MRSGWQSLKLASRGALIALLLPACVAASDQGWSTDVTGIKEMHLSAEYWSDNAGNADEVLKDRRSIENFNQHAFSNDPSLVDLARYPVTISGDDVAENVRSISKPFSADLYYRGGGQLKQTDYDRYTELLNLDALPASIQVRFGLVVQRADMRTWPTEDVVFKSRETYDLDRFQENGLFPADVVAITHESADQQWYFAQSYNYAAWVRKDRIALGDRDEILDYAARPEFLVVTGSKVMTNYNPNDEATSELQLDMGTRLPMLDPAEVSHSVDGQNPFASYVVELPVRNESGDLGFRPALIARSQDVQAGYLPFTRNNVVRQVFKFLGERYGWGHSYNARDCTGLVSEVYKSFGFYLPRNSGQQGNSPIGENIRFTSDESDDKKLEAVLAADVGDLLYSPGHVMMYLGTSEGQPYIIHDLSGAGWRGEDGEFHEGVLNGVSVTPLIPVMKSRQFTYFEQLYAIKKIR